MFNMTDQSVGIVPVTTVTKEDVQVDAHEFKCDFDKVNYERCESPLLFLAPLLTPSAELRLLE